MANIIKTIGVSGDYTTPAAAATAFVAGTVGGAVAGDDIVFNIIDNAAFNSQFSITANPTAYASYRLTVDPTVRHNGTYGSGARLVFTSVVTFACQDTLNNIPGTIEWLEITASGSGKIGTAWILSAAWLNNTSVKTMRNCMVHDNGSHSTTPFRTTVIGNPGSGTPYATSALRVHNNLFSNWKSGSTNYASGITFNPNSAVSVEIYNNTVDGIDLASATGIALGIAAHTAVGSGDTLKKIRNNVVTNVGATVTTGTKACFQNQSIAPNSNSNASDDATATGTGSLTNIVRGNNYNASGSSDYRPINNSAPIYGSGANIGTSPSGVDIDLKARNRTTNADAWSIGAYQQSVGGAVANGITISGPTAYRIYQRVSGAASVTINGTYSGTPTNIEVQVDGGAWSTLATAPTGGTYSGTISLATGTHSITVRFSNDTTTTATINNIAVGAVFLLMGQSNMDSRLTSAQTYTPIGGQIACVFDPDDTAWRQLVDPANRTASGGTWFTLMATHFVTNRNMPVGFVNTAEGGTSLSQWTTGSAGGAKYTAALSRVTASGINGFEAVLWDQGESDTTVGPTNQATYKAGLDWLVGDAQTRWGCPFIVAQTGTEPGTISASALDAIRAAQGQTATSTTGAKIGPLGYDRANEHWNTNAEGATISIRWWLAIQAALYSGTNGRGPRIVSAAFNSERTQIIVSFDLDIKTGLTFGTNAWSATDQNGVVSISSVAYHSTDTKKIVLTLGTAAIGTAFITFGSGNSAAGIVVPVGPPITVSGTTISLPAEPLISYAIADAAAITRFSRRHFNGGLRTLSGGIVS